MNNHITQDNLLKYQFALADESEMQAMAEHLAECAVCRGELAKIVAKFTQLDILQDDTEVSDKLREATGKLTQVKIRRNRLSKVWLSAAAILILAITVSVMMLPGGNNDQPKPGVKEEGTQLVAGNMPTESGTAKITDKLGSIDEKPPFAPASAIELNVLPRRDELQLTIYNSADLTLVREKRNLTIKRGWNWLQFMWANTLIDPTSLTLEPLEHKGQIDVQMLVYPAGLTDIGRWLIRSEVEGQVPVEITYFTSGISWRAFYQGTLSNDESKMHLQGYVRVANNSGEDYENAQTRLVVGQVHQLETIAELARQGSKHRILKGFFGDKNEDWGESNGTSLSDGMNDAWNRPSDKLVIVFEKQKDVVKESLSELYLYTIEGKETIENQWAKRLPSFEAEDIPVENLYKYDQQRWDINVIRFLSFTNDTEHNMGETPIPDGSVKVYRSVDDGHLTYAGGTDFKYIPVNDQAELNLGAVKNVKVEPVLMKQQTENYRFDDDGNIIGHDQIETWTVTVTNTREIPVKVEIYRNFDTTYWDIVNSGDCGEYEKEDADTTKYTLKLAPAEKKVFQYVLTKYSGTRQYE